MGQLTEQDESLATLEDVLRRRICSVCVDRNAEGTCGLGNPQDCALFSRFLRVVQTVTRVHSDNIDDYVAVIREDVCEDCINLELDGGCTVREEVRCALDRYLLLIVGAIEEARGIALKQGMVLGQA